MTKDDLLAVVLVVYFVIGLILFLSVLLNGIPSLFHMKPSAKWYSKSDTNKTDNYMELGKQYQAQARLHTKRLLIWLLFSPIVIGILKFFDFRG